MRSESPRLQGWGTIGGRAFAGPSSCPGLVGERQSVFVEFPLDLFEQRLPRPRLRAFGLTLVVRITAVPVVPLQPGDKLFARAVERNGRFWPVYPASPGDPGMRRPVVSEVARPFPGPSDVRAFQPSRQYIGDELNAQFRRDRWGGSALYVARPYVTYWYPVNCGESLAQGGIVRRFVFHTSELYSHLSEKWSTVFDMDTPAHALARTSTLAKNSKRTGSVVRPDELMWTCSDGRQVRLGDMDTGHLFNAMKMTFNHLASVHGGKPVWFQNVYSDTTMQALAAPRIMAGYVAMLKVLSTRNDLPGHYAEPLAEIRKQVEAGVVALPQPSAGGG